MLPRKPPVLRNEPSATRTSQREIELTQGQRTIEDDHQQLSADVTSWSMCAAFSKQNTTGWCKPTSCCMANARGCRSTSANKKQIRFRLVYWYFLNRYRKERRKTSKTSLNKKAVCITDNEVLEDLKAKETEKVKLKRRNLKT